MNTPRPHHRIRARGLGAAILTLSALPIDHLLARSPLRLHGLRIGPDVGSDHRSVSALLVFSPPG